jgi:hypothetical protein
MPTLEQESDAQDHFLALLDKGVDATCSEVTRVGEICVKLILEKTHPDERLKVAYKIIAGGSRGPSIILHALEGEGSQRFVQSSYTERLKEANTILERRDFLEIAEFVYELIGN